MFEALHSIIPFIQSREQASVTPKVDSFFSKGRWGFRYDSKHIEGWRRIGEEHRHMIEANPENFRKYLQSQSPAEQYAVLELISQPTFGSETQGEVKPQIEPKQVGDLYADLIRIHFLVHSGSPEVVCEAEKRKGEFVDNIWRLSIPQTSLMFTVLTITPDLSSHTYTEEVMPYVQRVVNNMGEQAKKNLGNPTISQLESLGISLGLAP